MREFHWEKYASVSICIFTGIILLWIASKLIFPLLLPFILSYFLSLFISPAAEAISKKFRLPKKAVSVVLFFAVLIGVFLLSTFCIQRLCIEMKRLLNRFMENGGFVIDGTYGIEELLQDLGWTELQNFVRTSQLAQTINGMITDLLWKMLSSWSEKLPQLAARLISSFPAVLLFIIVMVISGFYFCLERKEIENHILLLLPQTLKEKIPAWQSKAKHFSWRYVRIYLLLLLFTVAELFLGFSILQMEYAFLLAFVIAMIDLLPIFGVGTVLIPWGIIEIFKKNYYLGFGLLLLFLIITVLRQMIEPKLVGKSLGLHPLLTLVFSYAGWNLFGFLGVALGPIAALILKSALTQFGIWKAVKK